MYRDSYQRGMLTVFFSGGSKPLNIWETVTQDGYVSRFLDQEIKTMVLDICGSNISTTYMVCPKGKQVLGITMPFLVIICKNLKKYFSFEVTILDDTATRRRFRVSNFQSTTQILPLCTVMPIALSHGWNQIQFNLAEFTKRAYQKQFVEVQKVKINANIRLRRIYFTERLVPEDELPPEYKLYFPLDKKTGKKAVGKPTVSSAILEKTETKMSSKTSIVELHRRSQPSLDKLPVPIREHIESAEKEAAISVETDAIVQEVVVPPTVEPAVKNDISAEVIAEPGAEELPTGEVAVEEPVTGEETPTGATTVAETTPGETTTAESTAGESAPEVPIAENLAGEAADAPAGE